MEDEYGMADLRQYMSSRPLFPPIPQPPDLLSTRRAHPYDMLIFRSDSPATANTNAAGGAAASTSAAHCFGGFDTGLNGGGGDGGAGRWPRQETLTLLEIRSRLDPKFKEANQKGPLWDEVSRIMSEEHGYQRSGKKCREKFENLYKYYKKTKEGKAGRQDGKHYRFFRQLEALYGEANNNNNNVNNNNSSASLSMSESHLAAGNNYHSHYSNKAGLLARSHDAVQDTSLSLSNYSDADADTTSSEEEDTDLNEGLGINDQDVKMKKRGGGWKVKMRDFIDAQMKRLMEKQEAWMERMMSAIEEKERERMMREEEWRKQDAARIEREHKFWASERAWIEARDAALMDSLHKLTNKETRASPSSLNDDGSETMTKGGDIWPECEINRLIQLTTAAMQEGKFEQRGMVWEEIATKMGCFGHERSAVMCKQKWDSINNYVLKCGKKRKDNSKSCSYFQTHGGGGGGGIYSHNNEQENGDHPHNQQNMTLNHVNGGSAAISENCFRYFMGDGFGRIID